MATAVRTTTKELGDSRVRVDVEVAPDAVERELDRAASSLGADLKIPGFRKGKVPPPVVIQRVGREAVLDDYELTTRYRSAWRIEALRPRLEAAGVDVEAVRPFLSAPRAALEAAFAAIDADHGSLERFLAAAAGVTPGALERLREHLLA